VLVDDGADTVITCAAVVAAMAAGAVDTMPVTMPVTMPAVRSRAPAIAVIRPNSFERTSCPLTVRRLVRQRRRRAWMRSAGT
jgi:hypothetical protein